MPRRLQSTLETRDGVGLIEPVDDLRDDSPCENPELLELLTQEMIRLKFNQKEFLRTLMYTKTYQRECSDFDPSMAEFYHYPGPTLRRLTAEQVWDSILTLAIYNPYPFELPPTKSLRDVVDLDMTKVNLAQLETHAKQFDDSVGPAARNKVMNTAAYRGQVLARASELPSPLPAQHFLRQFGQCDRETIEGDSTDPTVPQILTMFNGMFTHMMLEQGSVIYDSILKCANPRQVMDVVFLTILSRPPTEKDRDITMREISRGDTAMGYGNVVWALINTRDFCLFNKGPRMSHFNTPTRRSFMSEAARRMLGVSFVGFAANRGIHSVAHAAQATPSVGKAKSVIYLYMSGAMSHLDTFDPKPGAKSQGETKAGKTRVPALKSARRCPSSLT